VSEGGKPIHFKERTPFEVVVGGKYYFSFGCRKVRWGTVTGIDGNRVDIDYSGGSLSLFRDELGRDPIEAIQNEVT